MKANITLDDKLMERVDAYADNNYMSRSGLISVALTDYLNAKEMITSISDIAVTMKKIADKGTVDHETMEQLEDLERLANLFKSACN